MTATWSLGSLLLGNIVNEESVKDAQLFQQPLPLSDSTKSVLLDLFGAMRTITLKGVITTAYATANSTTVAAIIAALDSALSGTQTSIVYTSGTTGLTYNVCLETVDWVMDGGDPNSVDYTLTLYEGSQTG